MVAVRRGKSVLTYQGKILCVRSTDVFLFRGTMTDEFICDHLGTPPVPARGGGDLSIDCAFTSPSRPVTHASCARTPQVSEPRPSAGVVLFTPQSPRRHGRREARAAARERGAATL